MLVAVLANLIVPAIRCTMLLSIEMGNICTHMDLPYLFIETAPPYLFETFRLCQGGLLY